MNKKYELLAPAGSERALRAAVQAGADAVYLGGPRFNARQSADNFTIEEMKNIVDYCHLYGVLVYVTVNTLIKMKETEDLISYAKELNRIGVDGVIVQDFGAVKIFSQSVPELPIHASTQMTVTSLSGVEFLSSLGIKRVVLARELSSRKIREIAKNTDSEIEIFIHGALCMCYSGQCLMSSIIGGRSGNRGRCAQPCRLSYTLLEDGKGVFEGYVLSPKDLSLAEKLDAVKDTGSVSLKIEGRLKRGEYVAAVTSVYKKYLECGGKLTDEDKKILLDAFNRGGFTHGFFGNETGKTMMCHDNPSNVSENKFSDFAKKCAEDGANIRKIPIYMYAKATLNQPLELTLWDDNGNNATVFGESPAEVAKNRALDETRLKEQLKKLGATPFEAKSIELDIVENLSMPVSEINNTRRKAVEALSAEIIKREKREEREFVLKEEKEKNSALELSAEVETSEQMMAAVECGISRIYVPYEIYDESIKSLIPKTFDIAVTGEKINVKSDRIYVQNIADIRDFKDKEIYGGTRLNVYNSYTIDALGLKHATVSPELNMHEIKDICKTTDAEIEVIAYGRLTLMTMANCPVKALGRCAKNGHKYSLNDRKNEEFPLLCGKNCTARLINSKPLYMADKWESLAKSGADFARLVFTTESKKECENTIKNYIAAKNGEKVQALPENTFTRGHFFRGVE